MTKEFFRAALIRAIRTVAQAALAMIPAAATLADVNWLTVLSTAALAGIVSILTSIATGLPEVVEEHPTITFLAHEIEDEVNENNENWDGEDNG